MKKTAQSCYYALSLRWLFLLSAVLLNGCSKKPPISQQSPPPEVIQFLSWHLRSNLGEFTRMASDLTTIDNLTHFRQQSDDAVAGLLSAGMWRKNSLKHQLHQRFGTKLTTLSIISVLKKGDSIVFHMIATEVGNVSSQYNLVYNTTGELAQGFVSNSRTERAPCHNDYLKTQYKTMAFGSCYADLADDWYLHHAYQHLVGKQQSGIAK